jgi:hypothetical protein
MAPRLARGIERPFHTRPASLDAEKPLTLRFRAWWRPTETCQDAQGVADSMVPQDMVYEEFAGTGVYEGSLKRRPL